MANLGSFDATAVEPRTAFEVVPPGEYIAQIVKSDLQPTKSGHGQRLSLELDILEGEYQGRKLFDGLNIVNQSAQAQEIGQRTLSAICRNRASLSRSTSAARRAASARRRSVTSTPV